MQGTTHPAQSWPGLLQHAALHGQAHHLVNTERVGSCANPPKREYGVQRQLDTARSTVRCTAHSGRCVNVVQCACASRGFVQPLTSHPARHVSAQWPCCTLPCDASGNGMQRAPWGHRSPMMHRQAVTAQHAFHSKARTPFYASVHDSANAVGGNLPQLYGNTMQQCASGKKESLSQTGTLPVSMAATKAPPPGGQVHKGKGRGGVTYMGKRNTQRGAAV